MGFFWQRGWWGWRREGERAGEGGGGGLGAIGGRVGGGPRGGEVGMTALSVVEKDFQTGASTLGVDPSTLDVGDVGVLAAVEALVLSALEDLVFEVLEALVSIVTASLGLSARRGGSIERRKWGAVYVCLLPPENASIKCATIHAALCHLLRRAAVPCNQLFHSHFPLAKQLSLTFILPHASRVATRRIYG